MEWADDAIVLGVRKHGETSVVAELMTRARGRHLGLVQGGRSRRMRPVLQPGNTVRATWRARLDEHLGQYRIEAQSLRAAGFMESAHAVYAVQAVTALLRLLPERDAHAALYDSALIVLDNLSDRQTAQQLVIRFEIAVLEELGFGLDLKSCASTGSTQELVWVSPKSGRAVSASAGAPYADRLLVLPAFLSPNRIAGGDHSADDEIAAGFRLTGHFLDRDVYAPRGLSMPIEREKLAQLPRPRTYEEETE